MASPPLARHHHPCAPCSRQQQPFLTHRRVGYSGHWSGVTEQYLQKLTANLRTHYSSRTTSTMYRTHITPGMAIAIAIKDQSTYRSGILGTSPVACSSMYSPNPITNTSKAGITSKGSMTKTVASVLKVSSNLT